MEEESIILQKADPENIMEMVEEERKIEEKEVDKYKGIHQLTRVAHAARSVLKNAVLLDPLIIPYCPTLTKTFCTKKNQSDDEGNNYSNIGYLTVSLSGKHVLSSPPSTTTAAIEINHGEEEEGMHLTSKAHCASVQELAYLSLVNFSDLLLCACACSNSSVTPPSGLGMLDKGAVQPLGALVTLAKQYGQADCDATGSKKGLYCCCCWHKGDGDETKEQTARLALASYIDATNIDGTDPALWFKLACAARALGRAVVCQKLGVGHKHEDNYVWFKTNPILLPYRRLERHALEQGYKALLPEIPPNRSILCALREFDDDELKGFGVNNINNVSCPPIVHNYDDILMIGGGGKVKLELAIDLP
eukprot:2211290-Ditylum_brightwellii.AAC.1